jgi:hypothetical protein
MFAFFSSLLNTALNWIFRLGTIKFVVFGALSLLLAPLMELLMGLITGSGLDQIPSLVQSLPAGILFYLQVFRLDVGIPMIVAAMLTKFFIRRLPVVG